eukprot:TRINITY_DN3058_c1_g2_i3.p1 TRINITY_DN3058_c1_g2~~TRINITY_DN3058_c1_g2_i3.p1  ORF type:complete len:1270 (-),score=186.24 TRINITY_DN3058_c1_g2_i3:120-3863(-)
MAEGTAAIVEETDAAPCSEDKAMDQTAAGDADEDMARAEEAMDQTTAADADEEMAPAEEAQAAEDEAEAAAANADDDDDAAEEDDEDEVEDAAADQDHEMEDAADEPADEAGEADTPKEADAGVEGAKPESEHAEERMEPSRPDDADHPAGGADAAEESVADDGKECDKAIQQESSKSPDGQAPEARGPQIVVAPPQVKFTEASDAPEDVRPRLAYAARRFRQPATTLNVMPSARGNLYMPLYERGFECLNAGLRWDCGMRAGRYMFEVSIVDAPTALRANMRIGLALDGSSLVFDRVKEHLWFDSDGFIMNGISRRPLANGRFGPRQSVVLVVDLEPESAHANTASLFVDGGRMSAPYPLPANFIGKAIYPTVNYRGVTIEVNFGPCPRIPLPFVCRMLQDASEADVEVKEIPNEDMESPELVIPIGLPGPSYKEYINKFISDNKEFTEISDQMIGNWLYRSGSAHMNPMVVSELKKQLCFISPIGRRNYVISEETWNLIPSERIRVLHRFHTYGYKVRAIVIVGDDVLDGLDESEVDSKLYAAVDRHLSRMPIHFLEHVRLPAKDEGFDTIEYSKGGECRPDKLWIDYVARLVRNRKLAEAVDVKPGSWFQETYAKVKEFISEAEAKQHRWTEHCEKNSIELRSADDDLDVMAVEDVNDLGDGEPLCACFSYEDVVLFRLRLEFHLVLHAFRKDIRDPERIGFRENNLRMYYLKYFKKTLNYKDFAVDSFDKLLPLVSDTISVSKDNGVLEPIYDDAEPHATFLKLTEDARRRRLQQIGAGDESAELKFPRKAVPKVLAPVRGGQWMNAVGQTISVAAPPSTDVVSKASASTDTPNAAATDINAAGTAAGTPAQSTASTGSREPKSVPAIMPAQTSHPQIVPPRLAGVAAPENPVSAGQGKNKQVPQAAGDAATTEPAKKRSRKKKNEPNEPKQGGSENGPPKKGGTKGVRTPAAPTEPSEPKQGGSGSGAKKKNGGKGTRSSSSRASNSAGQPPPRHGPPPPGPPPPGPPPPGYGWPPPPGPYGAPPPGYYGYGYGHPIAHYGAPPPPVDYSYGLPPQHPPPQHPPPQHPPPEHPPPQHPPPQHPRSEHPPPQHPPPQHPRSEHPPPQHPRPEHAPPQQPPPQHPPPEHLPPQRPASSQHPPPQHPPPPHHPHARDPPAHDPARSKMPPRRPSPPGSRKDPQLPPRVPQQPAAKHGPRPPAGPPPSTSSRARGRTEDSRGRGGDALPRPSSRVRSAYGDVPHLD